MKLNLNIIKIYFRYFNKIIISNILLLLYKRYLTLLYQNIYLFFLSLFTLFLTFFIFFNILIYQFLPSSTLLYSKFQNKIKIPIFLLYSNKLSHNIFEKIP